MGNQAIDINGFTNESGTVDNHITTRGSDWYWTVCAVQGASALAFMGLAYTKARPQRLFHYILTAITLVSAIAYFAEASNLGWAAIETEFKRSGDAEVGGRFREIFYVRYIDYFLTLPMVLFTLLLSCGFPVPTIIYTLLINEIFVVSLLVGALVKSTYKWGFYTFGVVAYLFIAFTVLYEGRAYARHFSAGITRSYTIASAYVMTMWLLYPIAWGVSEGGNIIPADSEAVFYGIIDILSKPLFGAFLLWSYRSIDLAELGINIRDIGQSALPTVEKEKTPVPANDYGTPVNNGTTASASAPAAPAPAVTSAV